MIVINIAGVVLIGLIIWWFWLYKPTQFAVGEGDLLVTVENGSYSPTHITLASNTPATLRFLRKDASPCAEIFMIPELDIDRTLPLNETISIDLPALESGEYPFHCQMQMYRGLLTVE
ncbi:MAG: plastocyanin domain-containing protein [Arenicella sp.]|jgi:plastocyanin domain-containing protein